MTKITSVTWSDYNLVRIAKLSKHGDGCVKLLEQLPSEEIDPVIAAFRDKLTNRLGNDNQYIFDLVSSLSEYPAESFGAALYDHLIKWEIDFPGAIESIFPSRYILLHDAHHVLLGVGADEQGEMEVIAFEAALCGGTQQSLIPVLNQLWVFATHEYTPDFIRIGRAWHQGQNTSGSLIDNWDIEKELALPLAEVRKKYNVTPL